MKTKLKLNSLLLILFAISTMVVLSCSKDRIEEEEEEEETNDYVSYNDYFNQKKQEEQEYTIDSAGSGPLVGQEGTKIYPDPTALMFQNGDSVTFPYTVKLIELYTVKDMIYYQMPNVGDSELLTCHGEIKVTAFKNGDELVLRHGRTWLIEMPHSSPLSGMLTYYGQDNGTYTDWVDTPAGSFSTTSYGYSGEMQQLGWVACSKDADSSTSNSNYSFTSTTDNLTNVAIFCYFPALESLSQVYDLTSGNYPDGETVKIVVIGIDSSDQLFSYYEETTVGSTSSIDVTMTQTSESQLDATLDAL